MFSSHGLITVSEYTITLVFICIVTIHMRLGLGSGYFWVQSRAIIHQLWSYTNTAFPLVAESNVHLMSFQFIFITIATPNETKP